MKKLITIPMALLLLAQGGCRDEKQPDHAYLNAEETLLLPETASKRVKPLPGVRQEGTNWVDTEGRRLQLRGTNLGNWLLMEFWMMNSPFSSKGEPIRDQCTLEKELIDRFGLAEKNRLMRAYYDSWITERDWDNMQAMGAAADA